MKFLNSAGDQVGRVQVLRGTDISGASASFTSDKVAVPNDAADMVLAEDDGGVSLRQSVSPATQTHVAYVHTKQFQASQQAEAPDPDEALQHVDRNSMPFD